MAPVKHLASLAALSFALAALSLAVPAAVSALPPPLSLEWLADDAAANDKLAWDFVEGITTEVGQRQAGTEAEAREKYDRLTSLILPEDGIALLNGLTGGTLDLSGADLDGPLPPAPPTEGMKSRQTLIRQIADENTFTIRQLYQWVASARGHFTVIGTPAQIADTLEEWFTNEGADGFNILPPWLPTGLTDFVDLVIPELQRRGLFRTAYEGRTLRENLGLPFPINHHAALRAAAQAAE